MKNPIENSSNLDKYNEVMRRYRNGEFGTESLTLHEILLRVGEPDLLEQMSTQELDTLIDSTTGITKSLFINIRNEKKNALKLAKNDCLFICIHI